MPPCREANKSSLRPHNANRDHRQLAWCDAWQAAAMNMRALEKVCASAAACARHGFVHAFALAGQSWSDARQPSEPVRRPRSQCAGTCRAAAHRPGAAHGRTTLLPFALPKYSFSHTLGADPALSKVPTPCARGSQKPAIRWSSQPFARTCDGTEDKAGIC